MHVMPMSALQGAPLRFALSKGRIFDDTLPLLEAAGLVPSEHPSESRKLRIPSTDGRVEFLIVRASDVPTYVQYGGADLGVVGKDVLNEHGGEGVLEPLDLGIARCRLMVAGPVDAPELPQRPRVATKFPKSARAHFASDGRQVELVKLYGSMELAPLVGLADLIVDVVDTGSTLKANGLEPVELIAPISARLIVNRSAMKVRHVELSAIIQELAAACKPSASIPTKS